MLNIDQMKDLSVTRRDIENKALVLNTAIDIQALLRLLVEKELITKDEINRLREEVRSSPKYSAALTYIEQTMTEIHRYEKDPQALLREMLQKKMGR